MGPCRLETIHEELRLQISISLLFLGKPTDQLLAARRKSCRRQPTRASKAKVHHYQQDSIKVRDNNTKIKFGHDNDADNDKYKQMRPKQIEMEFV